MRNIVSVCIVYLGADKSLARPGRKKIESMSGTRAISTTSRRELSSRYFLQGKAPKEIYAILRETLVCFLPGRAKDLSAPLYNPPSHGAVTPSVPRQDTEGNSRHSEKY